MDVMAAAQVGSFNPPEVDELVARCKQGELEAFDRLIARFQKYVFTIIYQHLGSVDEIDDIAQEVFLRIFKNIRQYREESSFETWVYQVTLNYIRSHLRWKSFIGRFFIEHVEHGQEMGKPTDPMSRLCVDTRNPASTLENRQLADEVLELVRGLPASQREVLIMHEVNDLTYEEAARILGVTVGTVKSRLNRARAALRRKVKL